MEERTRELAIELLKTILATKEPRWEVVWGLMGDPEGTVTVSNQTGKAYVRLWGQDSLTVRAWNPRTTPINTLRVDVRVWREEGVPDDYVILGTSGIGSSGYTDYPFPGGGALPPHAPTHEYDPNHLGSDIVNIYQRALVPLRANAQSTPDMTVLVSGGYYVASDGSLAYLSSGNSPTFDAAPASGTRYDLLYLNASTGVLTIRKGVAAAPAFAAKPEPQLGELPIAWIRLDAGDTTIVWTAITDARIMMDTLARSTVVGVLGEHVHVFKEDKSGECDGAKTVFIAAQQFEQGTLQVFLAGALQREGSGQDYTVGTFYDSFTMGGAPAGGQDLLIDYIPELME